MTRSTTPGRALAAILLVAAACGDPDRATLEASPDTVRFEPLVVGDLSDGRVVEWSNPGPDTLAIDGLRLSGSAADFVLDEDLCTGSDLPPGRACTVVVLFGPREAGPRAASLDAGAGFGTVQLIGEGVVDPARSGASEGLVVAVPETLDFASQPIGTVAGPLRIRLLNRRAGAVQFAARIREGEGSEYRIALDRCSNELLAPGRACSIQILFEPAAEGLRAGELLLRDLIGAEVQSVPLSGSGTAGELAGDEPVPTPVTTPPARLVVTPPAVEFGLHSQGAAAPPRAVRVKNEGASNVVITSLRIAGGDSESFGIASTDCERRSLVPTGSCSLEVIFRPIAPGDASARVEAITSSGVLPALVLLGGTGGAP